MPNAVEELRIHREIEALGPRTRAAVLLSTLGPETVDRIFAHLARRQIGQLLLEIALLPPVSPAARRRILGRFRARLGREGLIPNRPAGAGHPARRAG